MSKEKGQTQNEGGRESLFEGTLSPHTGGVLSPGCIYWFVSISAVYVNKSEQESAQQRRQQHSAFVSNLDTVHDYEHGLPWSAGL